MQCAVQVRVVANGELRAGAHGLEPAQKERKRENETSANATRGGKAGKVCERACACVQMGVSVFDSTLV